MKEIPLQEILDNTSDFKEKKVGYVAIVGRPNAGKSTFLNTLIWEKISIASDIPQTTRNKILAIYNDPESQILFIDTPWIHESTKFFNTEINNQALSSMQDADVILYFIDSSRPVGTEEQYIQELLQQVDIPVVRVYTKNDLNTQQSHEWQDEAVQISSVTWEGFDTLINTIQSYLPTWQTLFPEDIYTKQSLSFRIAEIIREKLFTQLKQELPHSVFVSVEEIDETVTQSKNTQKAGKDMIKISAYIYTETDSQKYIIIGKNGSLISKIGQEAREELETLFDKKVFLQLRAKTKKNWRKDEQLIKKMLV